MSLVLPLNKALSLFRQWVLSVRELRVAIVFLGMLLFISELSVTAVAGEDQNATQIWEVHYERIVKKSSPGTDAGGEEREKVTLYLSEEGFSASDGKQTYIYDGSQKRVRQLVHKDKTIMDTPIHSIVLANANELIHRSALCNAYESMKVIAEGEEPCSRFDLETLFSISLPDRLHVFDSKPLNVSKVESGSNVAFHYEKKEYVSLMPSSHKLSSDYLDSFQKFLILQCSIHPEIRRQLLEAAVIPQSLSFSYVDNSGSTSVYYNLESAQQVSQHSQFEVPADYSTLESDESLRRILEELGKASLPGTNEMMKELEAELERDTQAGNVVEAVLATQRYFLVTDDSIGYRKLLQRCGGLKDKDVRRVIYGLGTMDQLHDLMHKAEVSKSKYLGVVKYYMADLALGEHIEDFDAKSALLESLESDPFLVGAYVDLSRIYQTERDYYNAYRCLEAAKKINPTHSNLNAIKANELRLERDFKDWF